MDSNYKNKIIEEQKLYHKNARSYFKARFGNTEIYIISQYIYHMRCKNYYENRSGLISKLFWVWHTRRLSYYSYKTGFQIPSHCIDWGLKIYHFGWIVINGGSKLGKNISVYPGVTIGQTAGNSENVPVIGDNVIIYQNAMVCGKIRVGNNATILANSVVTHDVPENSIVGGIPAKVIRIK